MGHKPRLLVIGTPALRDALARVLPDYDLLISEHALDGVWKGGRQEIDGACVSLNIGTKALQAVRSLRQLAPRVRIVIACEAPDEPVARRALLQGADDYVLEPIRQADIETAFRVASAAETSPAPGTTQLLAPEIAQLRDVLDSLEDGSQAVLERLATLLQQTLDAAGVVIQVDDLTGAAGDVEQPVLEEVVYRGSKPVGRVALGRCRSGSYPAVTAGRLTDYARLIETIVAEARDREHWRYLAWHDDLSGLHNRRYFEQTLDELIQRAVEQRLRLTIVLFDIDDFKSYNDRFGHETGDQLIQEVAVLLKRCTREHDVVVRYGGDEFAVVFWDAEEQRVPGSEHPRQPMALATRFCKAIAEHDFQCLGTDAPGPITISGGLACFPWNGNTRAQLMSAADDALLAAKRTGKNIIYLAGGEPAEPDAES
jgi:diguanylate cyclase (GGDEF)-like protein